MSVNRRGFLSALLSAGVVSAADPERLLWEPGRKLISIPKPWPVIRTVEFWSPVPLAAKHSLAQIIDRYVRPAAHQLGVAVDQTYLQTAYSVAGHQYLVRIGKRSDQPPGQIHTITPPGCDYGIQFFPSGGFARPVEAGKVVAIGMDPKGYNLSGEFIRV